MAFDDRHTERNAFLAICFVVFASTIPVYRRYAADAAHSGIELSIFGHVQAFVIAGLCAVVGLIVLGLGFGVLAWTIAKAVGGAYWVRRYLRGRSAE